MQSAPRLFIFAGLFLAGCGAARDVAVNSFRVLDAPANFVRRRLDPAETTATVQRSDVTRPGAPVIAPSSSAPPHRTASQTRTTASTNRPKPTPSVATHKKAAPSATARPSATQASQFPTAKPVPGKPGYVYSIDPKGGIVDVTGYKSGDKAKDPYTQQVFIVP